MMARVLVSLLMTALLHCCHVDSFFMSQKADITPKDALVFIGQRLRVQCQLLPSTNISSSDIYFELTPRANDTWKIPQLETVIGNRNITTDLNITRQYSNYTTLSCKDRTDTLLKSAAIYVEYPIVNITNLTGTLFYDNSTIIFTWKLGQAYLDPSSINVTVDWNPLTEPNLSGNNCNLSNQELCLILWNAQSTIFIRINVSHTKGPNASRGQVLGPQHETSATSVYEFHPYDNLKTGPPNALKVENVTNTCVQINWEDSLYFKSNIFINTTYRIEIKVDDEPDFRVFDQAQRLNSSETVSVCGLIPFTKYSLSVQLRANDINPWSDRAIVVFETEEDRPLTGPPMTDTSYHLGECVDSKRDVLVYWTDPSKQSLRGRLVSFEVESNNSSKKFLRPAYNYYTDSVDCDSASQIRVYSATKVGPSLVASKMYIFKETDELTFRKDLMFMVEEKSGFSSGRSTINATVRWNAGDHVGNVKLIVYMCAETYIPNTCFNDFKTIEVNFNEKELQLIDIPSTTNLFGYASKDDNGKKSGIHWTNCVYQIDNKPDKPAGLQVAPGSQANSLEISWTPAWCNKDKKVLIIHYYLLICKQPREKCVDSTCCQNITISDFNISNHTAKGLVGGRPYYVYIQAESPAGLGYLSDVKVATPHVSAGSNVDKIVGITVGVVSSVLIAGFLIFCFFRHCWKSSKKTEELKKKSKEKTVTLPESVCRQDSGDSGAWTGSDPSSSIESRPIPPPSRPADVHSLHLSTHSESTVSSVIEISPVDDNAGAASHINVSHVVDDYVRGAPFMQLGTARLSHDSSHSTVVDPELLYTSSSSNAESSAPCMQLENASLSHLSHPAVKDPVLPCTSSASNTESSVARGSCVSAASGSSGAKEDAQSSLDADTNSSSPYMQFMNTDLSYDTTQPAPDQVMEDVPNESSSDSCPVLQLDQTSHLPQNMQQDIPMLIFHTHQFHEQTAPRGEENSQPGDYVICSTDGNILYQTEHCRPDTNSVVPQDILSLECQTLAEGGNQGHNSVSSGVEESETRSRIDSVVPMEVLLSSEHQLHHSSLGQNAAGASVQEDCFNNITTGWKAPEQNVQLSDFQDEPAGSEQAHNVASSNLQENHLKVDDHAVDNDPRYVRQVDANIKDSGGDADQLGVRPTHTCHGENTYFDDNTSLLSSRSDLSLNSSNCSFAQNAFNIDSLISNRFMNDAGSNFNMQGEDNFQYTKVSDGLNQESRNDPGDQDSVNVREAPEYSSSDHEAASFQASQNDFSDEEGWYCDHSGETSGDVELNDSRQQRVSFVDSSDYQPLPCLDTYSSCEESDLSQNSPTC